MRVVIEVDEGGSCDIQSELDSVALWWVLSHAYRAIEHKFFAPGSVAAPDAPLPATAPLIVSPDRHIKPANYKTPVGL